MKRNPGTVEKQVKHYLDEAEKIFPKDKDMANHYVKMARDIAKRTNFRLPKELQQKFCPHCYSFLKPGVNLTVRFNDGQITYLCKECKKFFRHGLHGK